MANTYKNKIIYNSQTLIDLTSDTVSPETLVLGVTAHDKSGEPITGTFAGTEWTSGLYQDEDGYICVSPLQAAGGIGFDDGMISFSENAVGVYQNGDDIGYGSSGETNGLFTNFVPAEISLDYSHNYTFYVVRPSGFVFEYGHTYKIVLDATCENSTTYLSIYLGTLAYSVFSFSRGQDGPETLIAELNREGTFTNEIMIYCRGANSSQICSSVLRSLCIYDITEENTNG